jgi:glycosyltransferase involved in cell wall biosynthesis
MRESPGIQVSRRRSEMHVCFVLPPFEIYAPERGLALAIITYETVSELRSRGIETTVITPTDGGPLYEGGRTIALPYNPADQRRTLFSRVVGRFERWDVRNYRAYVRACRNALRTLDPKPDVLVLFNDLVTGGLLEKHSKIPVLTWLQNEVTTRHRSGLRELRTTDGVLAVSSYIATRSHERYGVDAPPIHVVPNAVNASRFSAPIESERRPGPPLRTCFVGRIDPHKGPLLAARSVERLRDEGVDVTIDVAGPVIAWGQDDATIAAYVDDLRSTLSRIGGRWVGHVSREDLPAFYRDYDVAYVPSTTPEPFGLVALEAMASGCAVIASDRGGLPEVCGDAATLIDPENDHRFDAAIREFALDPEFLARAKIVARAHAEDRQWNRTADLLLDVIATLP